MAAMAGGAKLGRLALTLRRDKKQACWGEAAEPSKSAGELN